MFTPRWPALVALAVLPAMVTVAKCESSNEYGVGTPATAEMSKAWDIIVGPDGKTVWADLAVEAD